MTKAELCTYLNQIFEGKEVRSYRHNQIIPGQYERDGVISIDFDSVAKDAVTEDRAAFDEFIDSKLGGNHITRLRVTYFMTDDNAFRLGREGFSWNGTQGVVRGSVVIEYVASAAQKQKWFPEGTSVIMNITLISKFKGQEQPLRLASLSETA